MKLLQLQTNHIEQPLGFETSHLFFSWKIETSGSELFQKNFCVDVLQNNKTIYSSGIIFSTEQFYLIETISLLPHTKYDWQVRVSADNGEIASAASWFETGICQSQLYGKWIVGNENHCDFTKQFLIKKPIASARLYICGLGLFDAQLNGKEFMGEYLAPGCTDYNKIKQVYAYDIKSLLKENNSIVVSLGNGWYKGRYANRVNIFGDKSMLFAEIRLYYTDETMEIIASDESWEVYEGIVEQDSIYDGEVQNYFKKRGKLGYAKVVDNSLGVLCNRMSPPILIHKNIAPTRIYTTPNGEQIIDFAQNMSGFVKFYATLEANQRVKMEFSELINEEGNFSKENLRSAQQTFEVVGDGVTREFAPKFTYFGFRYVRISGFKEENKVRFTACAICSKMLRIGTFESNNLLLNRFYENTIWGQLSNFVDIPTDSPQRDERFGWTGDAQIFSETALLHFDCAAFFCKYLKDLDNEIDKFGAPTDFAPFFSDNDKDNEDDDFSLYGSSGWADAIAIIPYFIFKSTGDKSVLINQLPYMKKWIEYMEKYSENGLYKKGCRYGEWLALDGENGLFGATDPMLLSNAYYYRSSTITAKCASIVGDKDAIILSENAKKLRTVWRNNYLKDGDLEDKTQTAYAITLAFGLANDDEKSNLAKSLKDIIMKNNGKISTGFLGTPVILDALSENGYEQFALQFLLRESSPSWLWPVKNGATTVWERWNGLESLDNMNSLNHYQGGAVVSWIYKRICGFSPINDTGTKINFRPIVLLELSSIKGEYTCVNGTYQMEGTCIEGKVQLKLKVPFNCCAIYNNITYFAGVHYFNYVLTLNKKG